MTNLLGIDYGRKRMGLAFADELGVALPLEPVDGVDFEQWNEQLAAVIEKRKVHEIIVGYPLNMDGSAGTRAKEVDAFAQTLEKRFGLPVHKVDERLTTHAAKEEILAVHGRRPERSSGELDSAAATLILRDFLEERSPAILPDPEGPDLDHP